MQTGSTNPFRLTIHAQVLFALGFLTVLVALITGLAIWGLMTLHTTAHRVTDDAYLSQLASKVVVSTLQCRRYEKNFFLNAGDPGAQGDSLQHWHEMSQSLGRSIQEFEAAATSASDRQQARAWHDAWGRYIKNFGSIEIEINNSTITSPQEALKTFEPFQPNIQTLTDQAVVVAEQKATSAQQSSLLADANGTATMWQVASVAALVFVASVIWSFLFPAWLNRPIKTLHQAAARLASGDLSVRTQLNRSDEIGLLGQSFDTMAQTIQRNTADLEQQYASASAAHAAAEAARSEIAQQLAVIEQQRVLISEMSVPILPLSDSALVMPLIGVLDTERLALIEHHVLHTIKQSRAQHLILDITGLPIIDTHVAHSLIQTVQAARLLGCQTILVGIRPEVAQTIVGLGIDLSSIETHSKLQAGIAAIPRLHARHSSENGRHSPAPLLNKQRTTTTRKGA